MFYEKRQADGSLYVGNINDREEPGYYRNVPPWTKTAILRAVRAEEMTIRDIAKEFNVQERTVQRLARAAGIPPRLGFRNRPEEERGEIYRDYCYSSKTTRQIAKEHSGMGYKDIKAAARRWARVRGLPFRPRLRGNFNAGVTWGPWEAAADFSSLLRKS